MKVSRRGFLGSVVAGLVARMGGYKLPLPTTLKVLRVKQRINIPDAEYVRVDEIFTKDEAWRRIGGGHWEKFQPRRITHINYDTRTVTFE